MKATHHHAILATMLFALATTSRAVTRDDLIGCYYVYSNSLYYDDQTWYQSYAENRLEAGKADNEIIFNDFAIFSNCQPITGYFDAEKSQIRIPQGYFDQLDGAGSIETWLQPVTDNGDGTYTLKDGDIYLDVDPATGEISSQQLWATVLYNAGQGGSEEGFVTYYYITPSLSYTKYIGNTVTSFYQRYDGDDYLLNRDVYSSLHGDTLCIDYRTNYYGQMQFIIDPATKSATSVQNVIGQVDSTLYYLCDYFGEDGTVGRITGEGNNILELSAWNYIDNSGIFFNYNICNERIVTPFNLLAGTVSDIPESDRITRDDLLGSYFMRYRYCVDSLKWRTSASSVDITAGDGANDLRLSRFADDKYPVGGYFDPERQSIFIEKQKAWTDSADYYVESFRNVDEHCYVPTIADIVLHRDVATGSYNMNGAWGVGRYKLNAEGKELDFIDRQDRYHLFPRLCQDITLVPANTKVNETWTKHRADGSYSEGYTYNAASRLSGDTLYIDNYFDYGQNAAFIINRSERTVSAINQVINVLEDSAAYYLMADLNGNTTVVGTIGGDDNNTVRFTNFGMLRVSEGERTLSDDIIAEATIVLPFSLLTADDVIAKTLTRDDLIGCYYVDNIYCVPGTDYGVVNSCIENHITAGEADNEIKFHNFGLSFNMSLLTGYFDAETSQIRIPADSVGLYDGADNVASYFRTVSTTDSVNYTIEDGDIYLDVDPVTGEISGNRPWAIALYNVGDEGSAESFLYYSCVIQSMKFTKFTPNSSSSYYGSTSGIHYYDERGVISSLHGDTLCIDYRAENYGQMQFIIDRTTKTARSTNNVICELFGEECYLSDYLGAFDLTARITGEGNNILEIPGWSLSSNSTCYSYNYYNERITTPFDLLAGTVSDIPEAERITRDDLLGSYFMRYRYCVDTLKWRTSASSVDITAGEGANDLCLSRFANDKYPVGGYFDPERQSIFVEKQKVWADSVDYYLESFSLVNGRSYVPTIANLVLRRDVTTGNYNHSGTWGVGRYTLDSLGIDPEYLDSPRLYHQFSWLCQDITLVPANTKVNETWTKHRADGSYSEGYTYNAASRLSGDTLYIDNYFDYGQNAAFIINRSERTVSAINQVINVLEDSAAYYLMADLNGNTTVVGTIGGGDDNNSVRFTNFGMLRVSEGERTLSDDIIAEATIVLPFSLLSADDVTAIEGITMPTAAKASTTYYNLQGMRVKAPEHGVFIEHTAGTKAKTVIR